MHRSAQNLTGWCGHVAQRKVFVGDTTCNNSKMADGCHLEFQKVIIIQSWIDIFDIFQDGGGRHLEFPFLAIGLIWASIINIFAPNLIPWRKINSLKATHWTEFRFSKIQDGGRPPSWISILGHNFNWASIKIFCTKFGIQWWKINSLSRCMGRKYKMLIIYNFKLI